MKKYLLTFLLLCPLSSSAATVTIVDSWPGKDQAVLTVEQHFWVHLKYESPAPLRIWVRPYRAGKHANAISHGATLLPAGAGETIGWFAMREPGSIDEYRVSYAEQNGGEEHQAASVPVRLTWVAGQAQAVTQPEWIPRLQAEMDRLHRIEVANTPPTPWYWGVIGMTVLFGVPLIAITGCIQAFRKWEGTWRFLGGAPIAALVIWLLVITVSVAVDPTSHNLFPFEILMWAGWTLAWLACLWVVRKLNRLRG